MNVFNLEYHRLLYKRILLQIDMNHYEKILICLTLKAARISLFLLFNRPSKKKRKEKSFSHFFFFALSALRYPIQNYTYQKKRKAFNITKEHMKKRTNKQIDINTCANVSLLIKRNSWRFFLFLFKVNKYQSRITRAKTGVFLFQIYEIKTTYRS